MFWRWFLDIALLLIGLWCGNLALGYWWAAGGPPTHNPEAYATRGNVFFVLAVLCLIGFIALLILNIKRIKAS